MISAKELNKQKSKQAEDKNRPLTEYEAYKKAEWDGTTWINPANIESVEQRLKEEPFDWHWEQGKLNDKTVKGLKKAGYRCFFVVQPQSGWWRNGKLKEVVSYYKKHFWSKPIKHVRYDHAYEFRVLNCHNTLITWNDEYQHLLSGKDTKWEEL